jgi:predicted RNA-binding Zn ribbon-like protein
MVESPASPARLSPTPQRLGGALCFDFANTVDGGFTASPRERLFDLADLITWGQYAGLLSDEAAAQARQRHAHDPQRATADFQQAIALREAIFRTFAAIADGTQVESADLDLIQGQYLAALGAAHLAPAGERFDWSWEGLELDLLQRLLWPIARSAVEVLTSGGLERVKICASGTCRWLFVDSSKNATRRWCSMADCGSRAKMRRQYARRRTARTSGEGAADTAGTAP